MVRWRKDRHIRPSGAVMAVILQRKGDGPLRPCLVAALKKKRVGITRGKLLSVATGKINVLKV